MRYILLFSLYLFLTLFNVAVAATVTETDWIGRIRAVEKDIVDLTSELAPANHKDFLKWRSGITIEDAEKIVTLINDGKLKGIEAALGVLICTGLGENAYASVMLPLLKVNGEDAVIQRALYPLPPYGPGFSKSGKLEPARRKLKILESSRTTSSETKQLINRILTGDAERHFNKVQTQPEEHGFSRSLILKLNPKHNGGK